MGYEAKTKRARRYARAKSFQAKLDHAAAKLGATGTLPVVVRWPNDTPPARDAAFIARAKRKLARQKRRAA